MIVTTCLCKQRCTTASPRTLQTALACVCARPCQDYSVSKETGHWLGTRVQIPERAMIRVAHSPWCIFRTVKITTPLNIVLKLRICGALEPLPLYTFRVLYLRTENIKYVYYTSVNYLQCIKIKIRAFINMHLLSRLRMGGIVRRMDNFTFTFINFRRKL
jgi:hypothetical protein